MLSYILKALLRIELYKENNNMSCRMPSVEVTDDSSAAKKYARRVEMWDRVNQQFETQTGGHSRAA